MNSDFIRYMKWEPTEYGICCYFYSRHPCNYMNDLIGVLSHFPFTWFKNSPPPPSWTSVCNALYIDIILSIKVPSTLLRSYLKTILKNNSLYKNASNVMRAHYTCTGGVLKRNNHRSFWICVWGKLGQENHVDMVT